MLRTQEAQTTFLWTFLNIHQVMLLDTLSVTFPGVIGCFGSINNQTTLSRRPSWGWSSPELCPGSTALPMALLSWSRATLKHPPLPLWPAHTLLASHFTTKNYTIPHTKRNALTRNKVYKDELDCDLKWDLKWFKRSSSSRFADYYYY